MKRILKGTIVMFIIVVAALRTQTSANEPIKLIIDRQVLILDQPPTTKDGRVLVPLRGFFEALGAEVGWDERSQMVTAKKDNLILKLEIDKQQASVNSEDVFMDVPGTMINGRAMLPARFISENLGLKVKWDREGQALIITTENEDVRVNEEKESIALYRNTNLTEDYIEIKVVENHKVVIQGKTLSNNNYVLVEVLDDDGNNYLTKQSKIREDRTFKEEWEANFNEGTYTLNIYMNQKEYGSYQGVHVDIVMDKVKSGIVFINSPVYESNLAYLSESKEVSPSDLTLDAFSQKDRDRLLELATSITKDEESDYYKALAVSEWVSQNIYYDLDAFNARKFGKIDAIGTLDERRSICQGYAALTMGLLRSIEIPTKLVFGYALGINPNSDTWEQVDHRKPNHVWNEVFVDERWIIVDTTWNSKNRYEKGEYIEGDKIYSYFDPTIEAFSNTHKITNR